MRVWLEPIRDWRNDLSSLNAIFARMILALETTKYPVYSIYSLNYDAAKIFLGNVAKEKVAEFENSLKTELNQINKCLNPTGEKIDWCLPILDPENYLSPLDDFFVQLSDVKNKPIHKWIRMFVITDLDLSEIYSVYKSKLDICYVKTSEIPILNSLGYSADEPIKADDLNLEGWVSEKSFEFLCDE